VARRSFQGRRASPVRQLAADLLAQARGFASARRRAPAAGERTAGERAAGRSLLDLSLGALGLVVLSPAIAAAAAFIVLDDGAPVFFRQVRLGKDRAPFRLLKLRTMRAGRVTRAGAWLRATGLDEAPQFWNVVRGEMSVVGPRPLTPDDLVRLGWNGPQHELRFRAKPGVTGPVQVVGAISAADSARLEREYLARRSAGLDLAIVVATSAMLVLGKDRVHRRVRDALGSLGYAGEGPGTVHAPR
jgi:lipopolysaccharide/colanic/teichoic acid biosynthesis glycosyltransferase